MKTFLLIAFLLSSTFLLHAQDWVRVGTISEYQSLNYCDQIQTMTLDGSGSPYMLSYCSSGAQSQIRASKWFGTYWQTIGTGTPGANGLINANGIVETMVMEPSGNAYIAGFIQDNNSKYCVKKWDGLSWSVLGTGANALDVNGGINILALDGLGNLYAAGQFKDASGKLYVAKWDGNSWSALGSLNATVGEITTMIADNNGAVYVTGSFQDAYHNYYVAQWDGTQWIELGLDINNKVLIGNAQILTLTVDYNHVLYAAGQFYTAGRQYVAQWDGSAWSKVGGFESLVSNAYIYSLASDHSNNIYAAGRFSDSLGYRAVIKWDGSEWSQVGIPGNHNLTSTLFGLSIDNDDNLFVINGYQDPSVENTISKYMAGTVTGNTDSHDAKHLMVSPNPSKDIFSVDLPEEATLSIYNASGLFMQRYEKATGHYSVNLSTLPSGVYTLIMSSALYSYVPVKLIKE